MKKSRSKISRSERLVSALAIRDFLTGLVWSNAHEIASQSCSFVLSFKSIRIYWKLKSAISWNIDLSAQMLEVASLTARPCFISWRAPSFVFCLGRIINHFRSRTAEGRTCLSSESFYARLRSLLFSLFTDDDKWMCGEARLLTLSGWGVKILYT